MIWKSDWKDSKSVLKNLKILVKKKHCQYSWLYPEDKPQIVEQTNPVFPDYVDRINAYWNKIPLGFTKPNFVFDHNLLTSFENFDEFTPPMWFNRLTVDIINSEDINGRMYHITEFKFKCSLFADYDCVITTDKGDYRVCHDNVSDGFAIC